MAARTPIGGTQKKVEGEVANNGKNVGDSVGILTLVLDKASGKMTPSIHNIEMGELRLMCQQFLRMIENTIFEVERDKIKNKK